MNITDFLIIPFEEDLKLPLIVSNKIFSKKNGFIVKIKSENFYGFGESSPLLGFSTESITEISYSLECFRLAIINSGEISVDELLSLIPIYCDRIPSVEFGLETAIYDLISNIEGKSFSKYLNSNAFRSIGCNGIAGIHKPSDNFSTIKVKVGLKNLFEELRYLERLTNEFGSDVKLRLDANGSMDLPRAIRFCKEAEEFNIDYFEQPLPKSHLEDLSELRFHTNIPIAVDESLEDQQSAEKIIDKQAADVFIIKPTTSGGYLSCKKIVDLATNEDIRWLITSSIETPIGLSACTHIASALRVEESCGLSTFSLYKDEFKAPYKIVNGNIELPEKTGLGISYDLY